MDLSLPNFQQLYLYSTVQLFWSILKISANDKFINQSNPKRMDTDAAYNSLQSGLNNIKSHVQLKVEDIEYPYY